jgi:hypothetical protein
MRRHLGAAGVVAGALALGRMVRYEIRESSMEPALHPGDWVIGIRRPRRISPGDVVVFTHPNRPEMEIIKRVAAVGPGPNPGSPGSLKPTELWVLGDNPAAGSVDSRTLGSLDLKLVTARIVARYRPWPPRRIDSIAIR